MTTGKGTRTSVTPARQASYLRSESPVFTSQGQARR